MFVLDARSTDRTVEFARSAGATVVERDWINFLEARRFALLQVRTDWTLMLDADEALDDELRAAIISAPEGVDGYVLRRTSYFCGKPLRMWRNERLLRLFRTANVTIEGHGAAGGAAPLHERWASRGITRELSGSLLHFSYPDRASYREKFERYTDVEAASISPSRVKTAIEWLATWPRFCRLLLFRGAVLDGGRGIAAAYGSARYRYVSARKALR